MHNGKLVIWVNSPPFVERGAFEYLERNWPAGVVYAVLGRLRIERAAMGWGETPFQSITQVCLRGESTTPSFCRQMLRDFPHAMHLIAGLSSATGQALSQIVNHVPPERVAVFSERPGVHGPAAKRLAKHALMPIKYRWLVRRYRHRVGLLLPLGEVGVRRFSRYGWPKSSMASFMYCPPLQGLSSRVPDTDGPIRFLYVGRLSRYAKGTDILMEAVDRLRGPWRLTIVGGHGDYSEAVRGWAARRANIDLVGPATPHEVWETMARHHLSVVPSRVDGWNVVVNESLYAARGVIVTDQVASDEMIRISGAGTVIPAGSVGELTRAMQSVIDHPELVGQWSEQARKYAPAMYPDSVGDYVLGLLRGTLDQSAGALRPAPWLDPSREQD